MLGFIIGCLVGCVVGIFVMALCNVASDADDASERMNKK